MYVADVEPVERGLTTITRIRARSSLAILFSMRLEYNDSLVEELLAGKLEGLLGGGFVAKLDVADAEVKG